MAMVVTLKMTNVSKTRYPISKPKARFELYNMYNIIYITSVVVLLTQFKLNQLIENKKLYLWKDCPCILRKCENVKLYDLLIPHWLKRNCIEMYFQFFFYLVLWCYLQHSIPFVTSYNTLGLKWGDETVFLIQQIKHIFIYSNTINGIILNDACCVDVWKPADRLNIT